MRNIVRSNDKEIELIRVTEQLHAAFKGFPMPTYLWRHTKDDFILVDYNNAAVAFTNGVIKEFKGIRFTKMYENSPNMKDIESDLLLCLNEKKNFSRKMSYKLLNNNENKELIFCYVHVPPDLILVHTNDVTSSKAAEENLKMLSNAVEQTADSVVITDKNGIIQYVNPAFVETTGFNRNEALGKTPRFLKSERQDKAFYKNLWETILSKNSYQGTIINKKKNGELYWSQQTITPMKDSNGKITNFVSVLKDITELRDKQEQEARLKIASDLQERLLKAKISVPGFDIQGKTYAAIETCGDYFDFISMKDGSIGIVIGDVCGHGIGAALIMVQTRAYLRALSKLETDPGVILTQINQALAEDLDDIHYVTLIFARIDIKNNLLEYVSAGHIPAYLIKKSDENDVKLESTGIPLGVVKDYIYVKSEPIQIAPGDILTLITDGIVETRLSDDEEFGFDRTLEVIKSNRYETSENIIKRLYETTRSFVNHQTQEDDITSIICKVNL